MARTVDESTPPQAEPHARTDFRSPDVDALLARRRKLLVMLGVPALLCTMAYVGLLMWGRGILGIAVGDLNVGWVITLLALFVGPVICTVYGQLSTSHLDPLRERIASGRNATATTNGDIR